METTSTSSNSNGNVITITKQETNRRIKMENPFSLKVGQVFTGFGIGCGLGIGVGRPLNLGKPPFSFSTKSFFTMNFGGFSKPKDPDSHNPRAIPMLNEVMVATRGASDAFSGVGRHVSQSLRKIGVKNIEAGIGCGVGFGHGFGVGLAVKPGVVNQIQSFLVQAVTKMMMKFGIVPNLSIGQGMLPASLQSGMKTMTNNDPSIQQNPIGSLMQLTTKVPEPTSQDGNTNTVSTLETFASKNPPLNMSYGSSRTEKVLNSFLQNPVLKGEGGEVNELADRIRSENNMLQLVLKHQKVIDELMEENKKLRQILVEDLKVPHSKLEPTTSSYSSTSTSPCTECFECRRKQRRR